MNASTKTSPSEILYCDAEGRHLTWASQMLHAGASWEITRADSLKSACQLARQRKFDAIVVLCTSVAEPEFKFLRQLQQITPASVRVLLTGVVNPKVLSTSVELAHRIALQSEPQAQLINQIDQAIQSNRTISRDKVKGSLAAFKRLPSAPSVYNELNIQLQSLTTTSAHLAAVIAKDPTLVARLLRVVNSSYFGLQNPVSNIEQAISLLGTRTLRSLALSSHFASHYGGLAGWSGFQIEAFMQRSALVARLTQTLVKSVSKDAVLRDQAFLGALLADIGMLMLASEQGAAYAKVFSFAAKHGLSLHEVELKAFGVTHAELGAALLSRWNIAPMVVDAVLYHETPAVYAEKGLTPLAVVHVADALIPGLDTSPQVRSNASLDEAFLRRAGLEEMLPKWRMEANGFRLQSLREAS